MVFYKIRNTLVTVIVITANTCLTVINLSRIYRVTKVPISYISYVTEHTCLLPLIAYSSVIYYTLSDCKRPDTVALDEFVPCITFTTDLEIIIAFVAVGL